MHRWAKNTGNLHFLPLTHSHTMTLSDAPGKQAFRKHCEKREIARNKQFLPFPKCFLPVMITFFHFRQIWNCRLQSLSIWKSEICCLSLNIFILHRLRNKFLQLILISLDSASWELHQYSRRMCGPMKNSKVETRSQERTWDLMIARPTLYLTTTDTTQFVVW